MESPNFQGQEEPSEPHHEEDPSALQKIAEEEFELLKLKMQDLDLPPLEKIPGVIHDTALWMMRNMLLEWAKKFKKEHYSSDLGFNFSDWHLKQIDERLKWLAEQ